MKTRWQRVRRSLQLREGFVTLFIVGFFSLCLVIALRYFCGSPIPEEQQNAVHPGMTQVELRQILGNPNGIDPDGNWYYGSPWTMNSFQIYFDKHQKVEIAYLGD